jgi:uncharacterized membrane protein (DUF373 family)
MKNRGDVRAPIAHANVHEALSRYFEWAQDAVAASLAILLLVVMAQGLWTLARLAIFEGREPRVVLPQIVLLFIFVELYRTLLFYLREHRVSVGLMIEVAIVSILRELLINPPGTSVAADAGVAALLLVLGVLMAADRVTIARSADQPPADGPAQIT